MKVRWMLAAVAMAWALPCRAADQLTIVKAGRSAYVIAVEPGASAPQRRGAQELQRYLREMSGAELPIVVRAVGARDRNLQCIAIVDSDARARRGEGAALAPEEYQIRTVGRRIEIVGDARRGALYGCYAFLEDTLGVRWFTSRITRVPNTPTVVVSPLDVLEKPAFEYRDPGFFEAFDRDWAARNRVNGNSQRLDAETGGKVTYGRMVHTFNELVPPERYFQAHPEYYSLVNGKRLERDGQLCLTNPEVLAIATATVRRWLREVPGAAIYSVSQNDTGNRCECDRCRAVEADEGAASGVVLRFVNAIADAVARERPDALIDTLAYQWSEAPPKKVRPRPNVRVRLAPISACVAHPLDGCDRNVGPLANLKAWSQITRQLYVWHYATNFANYLQPLPDLDEIAGDVRLFKANGVVGLYYEGGYETGGGSDMAELKAYMMAKLMWNPGRAATPIEQEFLDGVYGKAAPFLRRWLDLTHRDTRKPGVHANIYDPPTATYLRKSMLDDADRLFDDAVKMVADDPVAKERVERAQLGLDYVRLMQAGARYAVRDEAYGPADAPGWQDMVRSVVDAIHRFGIERVREGEKVADFVERVQRPRPSYRVVTIENAGLRVDIVPQLGGRILRLIDRRSNRNLLHEARPSRDGYPAAGGYEEYTTADFRSAGWSEDYACEMVRASSGNDPPTVRLKARLASGLVVERTLRLDGDTLRIETVATNDGVRRLHVALRAHPEFNAPQELAPRVSWRDQRGGDVEAVLVADEKDIFLKTGSRPAGEWTLHVGDLRLTQRFDPAQVASVLLNGTLASGRVNLELVGVEHALDPAGSVRLDQTWVVSRAAAAPAP